MASQLLAIGDKPKTQQPGKSIQHQNFDRVGKAVSYLLENQ